MHPVAFFFKVFLHTIVHSDARRGSWENEIIAAIRLKKLGCLAAMKAQVSFSRWYTEHYAKYEMKLTPEQRSLAKRLGWGYDEFFERYVEQVSPSRLDHDASISPQLAEHLQDPPHYRALRSKDHYARKEKRRKNHIILPPA